jgi:YVTN family beta-propeller protein
MKSLRVSTNPKVLRPIIWKLPALLLVGVMLLASLAAGTALGFEPKDPLAYVTLRDATPDAGAVVVIDTTSNEEVATVEVGPGPHGMAVTSNGKRGYVANYGTFDPMTGNPTSLLNTVSVLKLLTSIPEDDGDDDAARPPKEVARVEVGFGPLAVAVTPDRREVYVTNFGIDKVLNPQVPGEEGHTVSVIKTASNKVVATIEVGTLPAGIAITPDGKRAYVTNRRDATVSVIDTKTHTVLTTVPVGYHPANVAISPDGRHAYVTNFGDPIPFTESTVSVIDTESNTVVATIPIPGVGPVSPAPLGVAVTPDGAHVYVVNVLVSTVSVIDTDPSSLTFNTVVGTVEVGPGPRAVAITPDGAHAYVTNFGILGVAPGDTVSVIDTDPSSPTFNTVVDTVPVAGGPNWVTIADRHEKVQKKQH